MANFKFKWQDVFFYLGNTTIIKKTVIIKYIIEFINIDNEIKTRFYDCVPTTILRQILSLEPIIANNNETENSDQDTANDIEPQDVINIANKLGLINLQAENKGDLSLKA